MDCLWSIQNGMKGRCLMLKTTQGICFGFLLMYTIIQISIAICFPFQIAFTIATLLNLIIGFFIPPLGGLLFIFEFLIFCFLSIV